MMSTEHPVPLLDAHCHLHDSRLATHADRIRKDLESIPLARMVVNGTHPDDWPAVAALAERDPRVIPAFGLHPWRVNAAPGDWPEQLKLCLAKYPQAVIGEVGLDRWIKDHDLPRQQEAFAFQLAIAVDENRPISIHCLRAWGPLLEALRSSPLPARGFHLHGYGGSPELVEELVPLGAYFSFSAYVMNPGREKHREALRAVPVERLLIETDAPDMLPPKDWQDFTLPGKASFEHAPSGESLHHPANITAAYRAAAQVRGVGEAELAHQCAKNFQKFFVERRG